MITRIGTPPSLASRDARLTSPPEAPAPRDATLQDAVRQLEGVFVEQLFKAMRETVPRDGIISGGTGEEMFSGLMDQHLAADVPREWSSGLADALLARFRARESLTPPDTPEVR